MEAVVDALCGWGADGGQFRGDLRRRRGFLGFLDDG